MGASGTRLRRAGSGLDSERWVRVRRIDSDGRCVNSGILLGKLFLGQIPKREMLGRRFGL